MKYIGSKNRLSKDLAPIIQSYINTSTKGYLEPFVGGANMIDKINCKKKIGCDIHEELIELLKYISNTNNVLPEHISEDEYNTVKNQKNNYPKWYVGLVGFCSTYSAKWFGGYARSYKSDGVTPRDMSGEAIRNIEKQRSSLQGINFYHKSFLDLPRDKIKNYVIYCDIPYRNTTKYKTEKFPYEEFYQWCKEMSVHNTVLISEYNMPDEFQCIWSKRHKTLIDKNKSPNDESNIRVEKLFICNHK